MKCSKVLTPAALAAFAGFATLASAQENVIITEVFYNPSGDEAETEWVEIYNAGNQPVDVSNWFFGDEDPNSPSDPIGSGAIYDPMTGTIIPGAVDTEGACDFANEDCSVVNSVVIQPGEVIVVISAWEYPVEFNQLPFSGSYRDGRANTIPDFIASWGTDTDEDGFGDTIGYRVISILNQITIANTATATNETLFLADGNGVIRDDVNYQVGNSQNDWPFSSNGRSVILQPNFFSTAAMDIATEDGTAWALAATGVDDAFEGRLIEGIDADDGATFTLYGEADVASPGLVSSIATSFEDRNMNGRDDALDIFLGSSEDCNRNRIVDESEPDGNMNGIPDSCETQTNQEVDCDGNGIPDDIDIANNAALDADMNGLLDVCDSTPGFGTIVITEIMFNPSGSEREYIELYNAGSETVDLAGHFFQDLDQPVFDGAEGAFGGLDDLDMDGEPEALLLAPGEILVVGDESLENWESGWGTVSGYRYLQAPVSLANNADLVNEVRTLIAPNGVRLDVANYQGTTSNGVPQAGWPGDDGRGSFHLTSTGNASSINVDRNNSGPNWQLSILGLDGARSPDGASPRFDGRDVGSPGFVNFGTPERASGEVVISEIFFATNSDFPGDPGFDGPPGIDEWVEIVNTTSNPVDISGWRLADEDGDTSTFPAGTVLAAGEAAVVVGNDHPVENGTPIAEFYSAWDCGFQVIAVENWYLDTTQPGLDRLGDTGENGSATNPSTGREILRLVKSDGNPADVVNYDDDGFVWPLVSNGLPFNPAFSIYVFRANDVNEFDNDDGFSWATSLTGFDGGIANNLTTIYNAPQFGSPGFVQGVTGSIDPADCVSMDACLADFDGSMTVDIFDILAFLDGWNNGDPRTDLNGNLTNDIFDILDFLTTWEAGCPA